MFLEDGGVVEDAHRSSFSFARSRTSCGFGATARTLPSRSPPLPCRSPPSPISKLLSSAQSDECMEVRPLACVGEPTGDPDIDLDATDELVGDRTDDVVVVLGV
jgi:hypothetical protein